MGNDGSPNRLSLKLEAPGVTGLMRLARRLSSWRPEVGLATCKGDPKRDLDMITGNIWFTGGSSVVGIL